MCGRFRFMAGLAAIGWMVLIAQNVSADSGRKVIVNGIPLEGETLQALDAAYGVIRNGRYWYDPLSGLWGKERGPAEGQIAPGLRLGGPLRADASGGGTGVFFNGRELHPVDVGRLMRITGVVIPGRYWIDARGVGGVEGGPPLFELEALLAAKSKPGRGHHHAGPGGYLGGDGECSYYLDPQSGSSVMSPGC